MKKFRIIIIAAVFLLLPFFVFAQNEASIQVIEYQGKYFPINQFFSEVGPNCKTLHYHPIMGFAYSIDNQKINDPQVWACGFGLVENLPTLTINVDIEQIKDYEGPPVMTPEELEQVMQVKEEPKSEIDTVIDKQPESFLQANIAEATLSILPESVKGMLQGLRSLPVIKQIADWADQPAVLLRCWQWQLLILELLQLRSLVFYHIFI